MGARAGYRAKMHLCFESLSLIYGGLHSFPGICFICLAQPRGSMLLLGTTEGKEKNMRVSDSNFKAVLVQLLRLHTFTCIYSKNVFQEGEICQWHPNQVISL